MQQGSVRVTQRFSFLFQHGVEGLEHLALELDGSDDHERLLATTFAWRASALFVWCAVYGTWIGFLLTYLPTYAEILTLHLFFCCKRLVYCNVI